jgi:DNA repair exonuclease SbcCD ATPase subunit
MGFKKNLPDSLELLLDTMCNTFGGIMFIAISLVVLSQLVTQQQKAMSQEDISQAAIEQLKKKIEVLLNENSKLSKLALNVDINTAGVSAEKKEAILRMKEAKEKNLVLEDALERLDIKLQENQELKKHQDRTIANLTQELEQTKKEYLAEKQRSQQEKQVLLEKIKELREKLANLQQPTLRFARSKATQRRPYWVVIQQNKIYRFGDDRNPLKGEVELKFLKWSNEAQFRPLRGTAVGNAPEEELALLFDKIDKEKYFVSILSDNESFSLLMITRQYLRNHTYLCDWEFNPTFTLSVVSNVTYEASE